MGGRLRRRLRPRRKVGGAKFRLRRAGRRNNWRMLRRRAAVGALALLGLALLAPSAGAEHSVVDLVSTGPGGAAANGPFHADFRGASRDGSGVFFMTKEQLASEGRDNSLDVYERFEGTTTLISTGPAGGNGSVDAGFAGASQDGSQVFFGTAERLVPEDRDNSGDVYERSGG